MTTADPDRRPPDRPAADQEAPRRRPRVIRGAAGAVALARRSAAPVVERLPATVHAARAGAREATTALQRLPDSTLRWLAASSVGLAAGFQLAGAPRLVRAAGVAPALFMGAAIALRPTAPGVAASDRADTSPGGNTGPTDEHTRGTISTVQGRIEEGLGKLTGDRERQAHGQAKQAQGAVQNGLGDVQDAVRGPGVRT